MGSVDNREFVKSAWKLVRSAHTENSLDPGNGSVGVFDGNSMRWFEGSNQDERWAAAAEFTRNRLEEIRQLEEEIAFIRADITQAELDCVAGCGCDLPYRRILSRLQSALADLKRGMKEQ